MPRGLSRRGDLIIECGIGNTRRNRLAVAPAMLGFRDTLRRFALVFDTEIIVVNVVFVAARGTDTFHGG
jgi:hypothetical protein